MRLIDVDTSIESVKNLIANGGSIEQALDAQPTAYDVDKLTERLWDFIKCDLDNSGEKYKWEDHTCDRQERKSIKSFIAYQIAADIANWGAIDAD